MRSSESAKVHEVSTQIRFSKTGCRYRWRPPEFWKLLRPSSRNGIVREGGMMLSTHPPLTELFIWYCRIRRSLLRSTARWMSKKFSHRLQSARRPQGMECLAEQRFNCQTFRCLLSKHWKVWRLKATPLKLWVSSCCLCWTVYGQSSPPLNFEETAFGQEERLT